MSFSLSVSLSRCLSLSPTLCIKKQYIHKKKENLYIMWV